MSFFWVQTTIQNGSGDYIRMLIESDHRSLKELTESLVADRLIECDRVSTVPDGVGGKVITKRASIALGIGYVGMAQLSEISPRDPEA
jgi:hypothetical protein